MKRSATLLVTAAILAAVAGVHPAGAAHDCSFPSDNNVHLGFLYCGEHWGSSDVPIKFKINLSSRPGNVSETKFLGAVQGAISEWNRAWPLPTDDLIECQGSILCLGGTTQATTAARDGVNAIFFASGSAGCGEGGSDSTGFACIWYSPTNEHRITEVDIVLNAAEAWMQPVATDVPDLEEMLLVPTADVVGDLNPDSGRILEDRVDLQSVLTHELGHAIGLEHVGSPSKWPARPDLDAANYQQTMYRFSYDGTTNKRSLSWGDIAGLTAVAYHMRTGMRVDT